MENEINEIQRVINTLNTVTVQGEGNLDAISACIKHLRAVRSTLMKKDEEIALKVEAVPDENDQAE